MLGSRVQRTLNGVHSTIARIRSSVRRARPFAFAEQKQRGGSKYESSAVFGSSKRRIKVESPNVVRATTFEQLRAG